MSRRNLSTSILGDAGQAEATVVPNLESLNTGNDQYVQAVSDTSEFNVYGQMKIYDNYWDTFYARHIVNAANAGNPTTQSTNAIIQSNTEGWVRCDHMTLSIPVEFAYYMGAASTNTTDYTNWFTNVPGVATLVTQNAIKKGFDAPLISADFLHPWFALLDIFTKIRLLIGNNGQQVQKQVETEPFGMKYNMFNLRRGNILTHAVSLWGKPNANIQQFNFVDTATYTDIEGRANYNTVEPSNYDTMISRISLKNNYDTVTFLASQDTSLPDVKLVPYIRATRQRIVPLPLQAIMTFFQGPKFLPPDFRFKFEIETNNSEIQIMTSKPYVSTFTNTTVTQGAYAFGNPINENTRHRYVTARALTSAMELQYPWHVLRQPVQAAISSMWLQKPFMFNYETIQITEITPTENTRNIHFPIAISSQRPTKLAVFLLPQDTSTNWAPGKRVPLTAFDDANEVIIRVRNTPTYKPQTGVTSETGVVRWTDCEIMFSGRTAYRLRNDLITTYRSGVETLLPQEFICSLWDEQSFRSRGTEFINYDESSRYGTMQVSNYGAIQSNRVLSLIIQPGGWAERGVISSRQGATTITINIAFANRLSANDRFVVVRENPEQCVFDSDKNITLIQWPAIKNNAGYLLPDITAAP